jgi:hypothetical protein
MARAFFRTGLLMVLGLALAGAAAAQTAAVCPQSTAKVKSVYREAVEKEPVTPGEPEVQVVKKYRSARLRDILTVEVTGLDNLAAEAACRGKDIVLYLDDRELSDVVAFPPSNPNQQILRFPLRRTEESRDVWTYLLGRPGFSPRETKVSIGVQDQFAIDAQSAATSTIALHVIPIGWFLFWLALFLGFLIGFFYLARHSNVLRDSVGLPAQGGRKPYSLARFQASWWFFLVLASYLFIGMITGDFSTTITPTVLILMGISAGTVVGSAFVDASKTNPTATAQVAQARQSLQAEIGQMNSEMQAAKVALQQNPDNVDAAQAMAAKTEEIETKKSQLRKLRNESESFLQDVLSDTNGVSFHRFQMLAWTIVLGIIFCGQVYQALAMPEFGETLLSLTGISAGTYLGLKIPEDTRA